MEFELRQKVWVGQTHVEVSSMQPVAKVMRVEAVRDDRYRKASTEDHGGQEENQDSTVPGAKCKMMSEKRINLVCQRPADLDLKTTSQWV